MYVLVHKYIHYFAPGSDKTKILVCWYHLQNSVYEPRCFPLVLMVVLIIKRAEKILLNGKRQNIAAKQFWIFNNYWSREEITPINTKRKNEHILTKKAKKNSQNQKTQFDLLKINKFLFISWIISQSIFKIMLYLLKKFKFST